MDQLKDKYCETCKKNGKKYPVRAFCLECREAFCIECSENHLKYKVSESHSLINLYQDRVPDTPGTDLNLPSNLSHTNEADLSTDFLESLSISENTVFYSGQVAVESRKSRPGNVDEESTEIELDISCLKATQLADIYIKRPGDVRDVWARCIYAISDKIIVADETNAVMKLFNKNGQYLSSFRTSSIHIRGITHIQGETFFTCGTCYKVHTFRLRGDNIVQEKNTYDMEHWADGMCYNGTYYCVLHRVRNFITILDRKRSKVRKIKIIEAFGRKMSFNWDIHMDTKTHNIYLLCQKDDKGVLCVSVEGVPLWFTPVDGLLNGIAAIHNVLAVIDELNNCVHLISKAGQYQRKLLDSKDLKRNSFSVFFEQRDNKLYVGYYLENTISVYSIETK